MTGYGPSIPQKYGVELIDDTAAREFDAIDTVSAHARWFDPTSAAYIVRLGPGYLTPARACSPRRATIVWVMAIGFR
jgi:hypothetical protein